MKTQLRQIHTTSLVFANENKGRLPTPGLINRLTDPYIGDLDYNGHVDVTVSCPNWMTIGLPTDHLAHVWQDWLRSNGFETQHSH